LLERAVALKPKHSLASLVGAMNLARDAGSPADYAAAKLDAVLGTPPNARDGASSSIC